MPATPIEKFYRIIPLDMTDADYTIRFPPFIQHKFSDMIKF